MVTVLVLAALGSRWFRKCTGLSENESSGPPVLDPESVLSKPNPLPPVPRGVTFRLTFGLLPEPRRECLVGEEAETP